jgi:hypothetical protein
MIRKLETEVPIYEYWIGDKRAIITQRSEDYKLEMFKDTGYESFVCYKSLDDARAIAQKWVSGLPPTLND